MQARLRIERDLRLRQSSTFLLIVFAFSLAERKSKNRKMRSTLLTQAKTTTNKGLPNYYEAYPSRDGLILTLRQHIPLPQMPGTIRGTWQMKGAAT
jgi:hypothetical protein